VVCWLERHSLLNNRLVIRNSKCVNVGVDLSFCSAVCLSIHLPICLIYHISVCPYIQLPNHLADFYKVLYEMYISESVSYWFVD